MMRRDGPQLSTDVQSQRRKRNLGLTSLASRQSSPNTSAFRMDASDDRTLALMAHNGVECTARGVTCPAAPSWKTTVATPTWYPAARGGG